MKDWMVERRAARLPWVGALLAVGVVVGLPGPARGHCRDEVRGRLEAVPAPAESCTSPWGWCTQGELGGRLRGTYFYTFTNLVSADRPEAPWLSYYAATVEITLRSGDLLYGIDNGTIDLDPAGTGAYASVMIVTGGTGAYAGATGYLIIGGTIDLASGAATGTYVGRIDDGH